MKRFLALVLSFTLLMGLTACGGQTPPPADTTPAADTTAPEETTAPPPVLPTSTLSVCGNDLAQYQAIAYFRYGSDSQMAAFEATFDAICTASLGFTIPYTMVTSFSAVTAAAEGDSKVILFIPYARTLEGFPLLDGAKPCYGVTDNGAIYLNAGESLLYSYLWRAFLQDTFGTGWNPTAPAASMSVSAAFQKEPDFFSEAALTAMGYTSVFEDNFDGDTLSDAWETRGAGSRGGGYIADSQAKVSDGILTLTGEYLTDGEFGEGFYSSFLHLKQWYCRGYFEASIKSNAVSRDDFWSAFWIQGPSPYDPAKSQGGAGEGGAELDILEYFGDNAIQCNIYCAGGKNPVSTELDADHMIYPYNSDTPFYEEYHTFGLLWDETGYIFQLDGVPYFCRNFYNGTSNVPEEVILSVCIPETVRLGRKTDPAEMKVDYLKIWQIPEAN